jgi:hypothetical protein
MSSRQAHLVRPGGVNYSSSTLTVPTSAPDSSCLCTSVFVPAGEVQEHWILGRLRHEQYFTRKSLIICQYHREFPFIHAYNSPVFTSLSAAQTWTAFLRLGVCSAALRRSLQSIDVAQAKPTAFFNDRYAFVGNQPRQTKSQWKLSCLCPDTIFRKDGRSVTTFNKYYLVSQIWLPSSSLIICCERFTPASS